MASASLEREVLGLAWPAIGHSVLLTAVFVVDRAMLGHHGEASLAAMQIAGSVGWSVLSVLMAFEVGTVARVGRLVGEGDAAGARQAARLSLGLAVGVGALLAVLSPWLLRALPRMFPGAAPATVEAARSYLALTLGASPLVFVGMAATAILQAAGDTRTPFVVGVVANALHLAANRVLILGAFGVPAMGIRGCAWSTVATLGLEAVVVLAVLARGVRGVSLVGPPSPRPIGEEAREMARVAGPAILERVLHHAGFLVYAGIVASLGDLAMAANQALISVESVCFLSGDGFAIAAASLVARKLGGGERADAAASARIAARHAVVLLGALGLLFVATRRAVLPAFGGAKEVTELGVRVAPILAAAQPAMAVSMVLAQALRGAGRTRPVLLVTVLGAVAVRVVATWALALHCELGLVGVWLGSTCDWIVRALLFLVLIRRVLPASA
jgi:putative MATE family efflux protein